MNTFWSRPCQRYVAAGRAKSGFTLIELLVVIAIIAILASILFPVFSRARKNARRASCQSNLKQLGLGIMQYTQDYDERLPGATDGPGPMGGGGKLGGWTYFATYHSSPNLTFDPTQGNIYPYVKNTQVYVCPSDATDQAQSYAINSCVDTAAGEPHGGKKLSYFQDTSSWMLLCEEGATSDQANGSTDDGYMSLPTPNVFSTRHFGGSDISFIDGHVKWFTVNDLVNKGFQTGGTGACT